MSQIKKHVGRIKNTDRRCVVIYMQIPGNDENALIVDTDALPDRFHDALMSVIDSVEAQQVNDLHTLLARRVMPDTNVDMLNSLHAYGLLRAVPIDNIIMFPAPNSPCPLRMIVDHINGTPAQAETATNLENRVLENQKADATQAQVDIAKNILQQAADLEAEANKKREQAYRMVPGLRPAPEAQVTPSPEVIEASVPADLPTVMEAPESATMTVETLETITANVAETAVVEGTEIAPVAMEIDPDLPQEVIAALKATMQDMVQHEVVEEPEDLGNQVDTSDEALQAFLDRVAHREDMANKELQESLKPKNPVGRPRKDGLPAGVKAEVAPPAPKKRGRPRKNPQ